MLRQPEERPEASLARLGIRPEDVTHVLITPLQAYATGNIPMFRNARICLSRRGWIEDFHAPRFPVHSPRWSRIPNEVLMYLELEGHEKVRLLEDEDEVAPGLRAHWVGAHHRSSMAFELNTAKGEDSVMPSPVPITMRSPISCSCTSCSRSHTGWASAAPA